MGTKPKALDPVVSQLCARCPAQASRSVASRMLHRFPLIAPVRREGAEVVVYKLVRCKLVRYEGTFVAFLHTAHPKFKLRLFIRPVHRCKFLAQRRVFAATSSIVQMQNLSANASIPAQTLPVCGGFGFRRRSFPLGGQDLMPYAVCRCLTHMTTPKMSHASPNNWPAASKANFGAKTAQTIRWPRSAPTNHDVTTIVTSRQKAYDNTKRESAFGRTFVRCSSSTLREFKHETTTVGICPEISASPDQVFEESRIPMMTK